MKKYIALVVTILILCGCVSTERATRTLKKRGVLDDVCAATYPAVTTGFETTENEESMEPVETIIEALETLGEQPAPVPPEVPAGGWNADCDTVTEALFRAAAERERVLDTYRRNVTALKRALDTVKPVVKLVEDKAVTQGLHDRITLLEDDNRKSLDLIAGANTEKEVWKRKARTRFWWLAGIGAAVALGLIFLIAVKNRKQWA